MPRPEAEGQVLTWRRGAAEASYTAQHNGHLYHMWKGLDGWWRVKVNGQNMAAPDGTATWGIKASASDAANRDARTRQPATAAGSGRA